MEDKIKNILDNFMIDYYGVADISDYENEITKYGGNLVKGYPKAISLGIVFPSIIVDHLYNRSKFNQGTTRPPSGGGLLQYL